MKLILITPPEWVQHELETIHYFLEMEKGILHVRKPTWSEEELINYIDQLPDKYLNNVAIHSNSNIAVKYKLGGMHLRSVDLKTEIPDEWKGRLSKSAHSFSEINQWENSYDYFFLSPVFDSISKSGYKSSFNLEELGSFLQRKRNCEVIGLGGIDSSNILQCMELGFDGIAVLGAIWNKKSMEERIQELEKLSALTKKKTTV